MVARVAAVLGALGLVAGSAAADRGADGTFDQRSSPHFVLLQDVDIDEWGGFYGSRRFEQGVLSILERAYERLEQHLGLRPPRKIQVVLYDPGVFDRQFRGLFRFSAAGFYHGVIRIRGAAEITGALARVLHHELVHAALDAAAPSLIFPGWMNEGLAEWFEARSLGKRGLNGWERGQLQRAARQGRLFSLAALSGPAFGHLGDGSAAVAYLQSYAFVDFLARHRGEGSLERFVREVVRTRDLDRSARRVYRDDLAALEKRFAGEWR